MIANVRKDLLEMALSVTVRKNRVVKFNDFLVFHTIPVSVRTCFTLTALFLYFDSYSQKDLLLHEIYHRSCMQNVFPQKVMRAKIHFYGLPAILLFFLLFVDKINFAQTLIRPQGLESMHDYFLRVSNRNKSLPWQRLFFCKNI